MIADGKWNKCLIVLNFNNGDETLQMVENMKQLNFFELIIVVDNGSTDNSLVIFNKNFLSNKSNVIFLKTGKNLGYSGGNNFGLNFLLTQGYDTDKTIVYISNPDIRCGINELEAIKTFIKDVPYAGQVSIKGEHFCSSWNRLSVNKELVWASKITRRLFSKSYYRNKYEVNTDSDIQETDVVLGAFFAVKLSTFVNVDFFDEEVFLYSEEDILSKKLQNKFYKNFILNNYSYKHIGGTSSNNINDQWKTDVATQSRKYYLQKYMKANKLQLFIYDAVRKIDKYFVYLKTSLLSRRGNENN